MGWTSKMRKDRYPKMFYNNGAYKGGRFANFRSQSESNPVSEDTRYRYMILEEIKTRIKQGETLDVILDEIAQREDVKKQFDYYIKNGITDLASIFKNWYLHFEKNKNNNFNKMR